MSEPSGFDLPKGPGPLTPVERNWGMFAHLSALAGLVVPFGSLLGPLIVWQLRKEEMPFVDDQGKEALDFQITVFLALVASTALIVVLIGFVLLPLVALAALVLTVVAGIRANAGEQYRYPFALRLIK